MLDIQSVSNNSLIIINNDTIHLFKKLNRYFKQFSLYLSIKNPKILSEYLAYNYKHSCEVTSANFLLQKNLIAFTDLNKFFYLLDYMNNDQIVTKKYESYLFI